MRFSLISSCLACIFLLPDLAEQLDFILPLRGIINIPATGLNYMAVMFHELGHAFTAWLFGMPSLPSFDFEYGGGMTYSFGRSNLLLGAVYAVMAGGVIFLYRQMEYFLLMLLAIFAALHLALAFNNGHTILAIYMGQGGEILIGSFCIWRAALKLTSYGVIERYLNMIFGIYIFGRNLIISGGIIFSDISRIAYSTQKGQHNFGDFSQLAEYLNLRIETVAVIFILFMALCLAATLYLVRQRCGLSQLSDSAMNSPKN